MDVSVVISTVPHHTGISLISNSYLPKEAPRVRCHAFLAWPRRDIASYRAHHIPSHHQPCHPSFSPKPPQVKTQTQKTDTFPFPSDTETDARNRYRIPRPRPIPYQDPSRFKLKTYMSYQHSSPPRLPCFLCPETTLHPIKTFPLAFDIHLPCFTIPYFSFLVGVDRTA